MGQADGNSLASDLAGPLIIGTVEARWRSLAGAAGLAAGHEAFQQGAAAKVAQVAEGALKVLVVLCRSVVHRHRA